MRFFTISVAAFLYFSACLQAQEYSYVNYNTRDGLAGSVVYCMMQDPDGFMWFGTEAGLSRFDGTRFTNFTMADGLPDNEIIKLFTDSKRRLWIVPFKNSLCYFKDGRIHTAQNDSLLKSIPIKTEVVSILEQKNGNLIIADRQQLTIIKKDGQLITLNKAMQDDFFIAECGHGMNGNIALVVRSYRVGLSLWELKNDTFSLVQQIRDTAGATSPNLTLITPNLYVWSENHTSFTGYTSSGNKVVLPRRPGALRLKKLNDSILASCSNTSVETFNIKQQQKQYTFFTNRNINDVMEDREGNLWFSSLNEGIFRLASTEFRNLSLQIHENSMPVNSLKKTGPLLYIGTDRFALWTLNTITRELSMLFLNKAGTQGRVTTIDTTQYGLMAGTDHDAFFIRNKHVTRLFNTVSIKAMTMAGDDVLMATSNGTYAMNMVTRSLRLLQGGRTTTLYLQGDSLFIGTLDGLYARGLKDNGDRPGRYLGAEHMVFKSRITAMAETPDGVLWMATYGRGVVGYKNGRITAIVDQSTGLTSNICRSIHTSDSIVWIGTDKGLNKLVFTADSFSITRFTRADGLMSEIINAIAVNKDTVYIGTPEGLTWFTETKVFTNSMCELKVTQVNSDKKSWVSDFSAMYFDHYDNNIRFEYAGISFKSAGEITYHYRLLGIDDTWRTTTANYLNFPTLPSGEYDLQLKAVNKFGVQSRMVSIRFSIAQLIWEKTWFRILCMILLGVGIWIFVQTRIQRIKKREALKSATNSRMAELEQMALKAQMNPHFIFNTLNSIQQYIFDKDVQDANKFIIEFSRLIRLTLDISSKTKITISEEVNYISTYLQLEKRRFEDKFDFCIHVSNEELLTAYIPPMILQPYVENSIRHGVRYRNDSAGLISVQFHTTDHYLVCTVEDNGVGREASKQFKGTQNIEYQSRGMTLTARRIEMMNRNSEVPIDVQVEDQYDEAQVPLGTKVTIRFPLHRI